MADSETLVNPFPGLRSFEENEEHLFFGREKQTDELLIRLRSTKFLAVLGTSGSGKSSLIKSGLLPSLHGGYMTQAGSNWRVCVFRPGIDPIGNMAIALAKEDVLLQDKEMEDIYVNIVEAALRRGNRGLIDIVNQARLQTHENLLIVVDQFEEIFRFSKIEKGKNKVKRDSIAFIDLLLKASQADEANIYVVITMRSDFLGDCTEFRGLPEVINAGQYLVPRMTREEKKLAIEGPISVSGGTISSRLLSRLLNDVGDNPDQLPILQHALMRTWDHWAKYSGAAAEIDLEHYEAIGTMKNALSQHAEEAYNELETDEMKYICKLIFKGLTDKGDNNRGTRRPSKLYEICELVVAEKQYIVEVINTFRKPGRTFLVPSHDIALDDEAVIDIAHESLMRIWKRLIGWVEEEVQAAEFYERLSEAASLHNEGKIGLWRMPELQLGLNWYKDNKPNKVWAERYNDLFYESIKFLNESKKQYNLEIAQKEKQQRDKIRRSRTFTGILGVAAIISILLSIIAFNSKQEAEKARSEAKEEARKAQENYKKARVNNLASLAIQTAEINPTLGLRLVEEAIKLDTTEAAIKAIENIYYENVFYKTIAKHDEAISDATFSPDQKYILTASDDRTAKLWDLEGNNLQTFNGHIGSVHKARFSPDGQLILTGSEDNTARLWDLQGNNLQTFEGHNHQIQAVAFSPDGHYILTGSDDSTAILWDLQGKLLQVFKGHKGAVLSVCFSPDGKQVLTSSIDKTARLWSLKGKQIQVFKGHEYHVYKALFSSDGQFVLTGANDYTVRMWDLKGKLLQTFRGHDEILYDAALSSDDQFVMAGISDKIYLWNRQGVRLQVFKGHKMQVESVCFSPDDQFMLTSGSDRTAALWDLRTIHTILEGHEKGIYGATFSPDQKFILTCADDYTIRLWNTQGKQLKVFRGHSSYVNSVVTSPDGKLILTGSSDKTARLWDLNGNTLKVFNGHEADIWKVAFSPDGKYILTGSADKTARLWDLQGNILQVFRINGPDIRTVAFSPDGQSVLTDDKNTARLWDLKGNTLQTFRGHKGRVRAAVFSPDGRYVLTGSVDRTARLWDLQGNTLQSFVGHTDRILTVAFSPDGKTVLTGSSDNNARLWDLHGKHLQSFKAHTDNIYSVSFSPDNQHILTGSGDRTARIWKRNISLREFLEKGILAELTVSDMLEFEFLDFNKISFTESPDTLLEGARYYTVKANETNDGDDKKEHLNNAIYLYKKLLVHKPKARYYSELIEVLLDYGALMDKEKEMKEWQAEILYKLLEINNRDELIFSIDYYTSKATEYSNYAEKLIWQNSGLTIAQKCYELFPDDENVKRKLIEIYYHLTQYYILAKQLPKAITTAQEGFKVHERVGANLFLAYMIDNKHDKAESVYLQLKNKSFHNKSYKDIILTNIELMEDMYGPHKGLAKAREVISK